MKHWPTRLLGVVSFHIYIYIYTSSLAAWSFVRKTAGYEPYNRRDPQTFNRERKRERERAIVGLELAHLAAKSSIGG